MGAYSPVPEVGEGLVDELLYGAVEPLVAALRARGIDYRGVLYAGLMLTPEGPKVLEYNVRFGDPEAQVVLPRLADDPVEVLTAVAAGRLADLDGPPAFSDDATVCVVLACAATPAPRHRGPYRRPRPTAAARPVEGVTVIHAATRRQGPDEATALPDRRGAGARDHRRSPPPWPRPAARAYRAAGTVRGRAPVPHRHRRAARRPRPGPAR